jgi:hypothetical protein
MWIFNHQTNGRLKAARVFGISAQLTSGVWKMPRPLPPLDVFLKCLPAGWTAEFRKDAAPPHVQAYLEFPEEGLYQTNWNHQICYVPRPTNIQNVLIFLHECGHAHLHREQCRGYLHNPTRLEYEAEVFAIDAAQRLGIDVPLIMRERSRRYVAGYVKLDRKNGDPVYLPALQYAKGEGRHGILEEQRRMAA